MIHHSFIVRFYSGPQGRWHGHVTHVETQETQRFVQLDALAEFITRCREQALALNAELGFEAGGSDQSADNPFSLDTQS